MTELLRDNLRLLSEDVQQVDLADRVRVGSRRAARRRTAFAAAAVIAIVGMAMTVAFALPTSWRVPPADPSPSLITVPPPTPAGAYVFATDPPPDTSLDGVALTVPAWPGADADQTCGGEIVLHGGSYNFPTGAYRQLRLVKAVPHGPRSVAALFQCPLAEPGRRFQVVDYERDAATYRVHGQVLVSRPGGVEAMFDLDVAGAEIRVEVGDWAGSLTANEASHFSVHQWRAYAWNGGAFTQVGGPTTFAPNPNEYALSVAASPLVFGPPRNATRTGTVTLTLRNTGSGLAAPADVTVSVGTYTAFVAAQSTACPGGSWASPAPGIQRCPVGRLAAGASIELSLVFTVATTLSALSTLDDEGSVSIGEDGSPRIGLGDTGNANRRATFTITLA
jgi:hypothetical protein